MEMAPPFSFLGPLFVLIPLFWLAFWVAAGYLALRLVRAVERRSADASTIADLQARVGQLEQLVARLSGGRPLG